MAIVFSFSCVFAEAPDYKKLNGDIAEKKATYENNKTDANKKALQDAEKALDDALKSDPSNLASSAFTIDINTILPSVDMG
ncbi:MAG: hypothetical protein LBC61_07670 [Candidatus Peribacteria bacterium]|nr:hypothetical protein [Candidatus Peribacteria bacterium]